MKKLSIFLSFLIIILSSVKVKTVHAENSYYARNYIVMNTNSHKVLEGKDVNSSSSVASISKIMTAIIALESDKLFYVVEVDEIINTVEGSSLYLSIGDKITILDLVYGLLLRSGNDAAVLIADNVAKDVASFVVLMNEKAKSIGMKNTIFNNPSGLDIFDNGNLSSCYDMALLMSYCMENELFREIVNTKSYKNSIKGVWINKNKLLKQYEYCIGGKTGYTKKAKRTLITSAKKGDMELIVVTFNCSSDFAMHKFLYEKYFNNYEYITFLTKGKNNILEYEFISDKHFGIMIEKNKAEKAKKLYRINSKNNELSMYLVLETNESLLVGKIILNSFSIK